MTFVFCAISLYYFQTQPRCLFPRLVDQFVLPLPNSKKPVAPLVMQCIKAHLHQVFGSKYSSNSQFSTERNLRFHWFFSTSHRDWSRLKTRKQSNTTSTESRCRALEFPWLAT